MSINTLNTRELAGRLTGELDKLLVQKAVTGFMTDNGLKPKFMGTKTVLIPEMELSGAGDYDRDTGFVQGSISLTSRPFELTMDRGRSFQLDAMDLDETGVANLTGQVMGEFVRTKMVPEVDAFVLSKLAGLAVSGGQTVTCDDVKTGVYELINDAINKVSDATGYGEEELVAFVNPTVYAAVQSTPELVRQLVVSDFKKGGVDTKVKSINGVAILPVSDARMKTAYTFNDGTTGGQEDGGFVATGAAKSIGLLVLPKRAASIIRKTEKIRSFSPDQNQKADAWRWDYRLFYDVVVKNSMLHSIFAYTY